MYFRLTSSFKTCATWSAEIFSRAERSWILASEVSSGEFVGGTIHAPNHCDTYRPRSIADRQTEIGIVGFLVLTLLHVVDNLCNTSKHVGR